MSIFNRITATLSASVDKAVGQIENHDAVIDASIRDCRASLAKARVYNARVTKDGEGLRAKLKDLKQQRQSWEDRAKSVADSDEKMALDCLHRRNVCNQAISRTEAALVQHSELEEKVRKNLSKIEQRLTDTSQQRNMMRSRQSAADAVRTLNRVSGTTSGDVDDAFERWEIVVGDAEYEVGEEDSVDRLDTLFREKEDEAGLRAELQVLMVNREEGGDE